MDCTRTLIVRSWVVFFGLTSGVPANTRVRESIVVASASTSVRPAVSDAGFPAANAGIERNQSAVIDVCRSYVEAQLEYLRTNADADGVLVFAKRIRSTPGTHDGLYWPVGAGEEESPVGPNIAAAAIAEQPSPNEAHPFSGYFFKMMLAQGPAAKGGARGYFIDGRLLTGFALIAWPAEYGVSGVYSFIVSHLGDVYARDLGPDTGRIVAGISAFNPDEHWTKVPPRDGDR